MILTGEQIRLEVESGNITLDPFDPKRLNPNSYNYGLGEDICDAPIQTGRSLPGRSVTSRTIPHEGVRLEPGKVYLSHTRETIGSKLFVTSLIGRSSVGRLGIFVQLSADLGNLGPAHRWTLELTCVQPVIIYPGMTIGQLSFWQPEGSIVLYAGSYTDHSVPTPNLLDLFS